MRSIIINDPESVYNYQKIESELYNVKELKPNVALFPNQVFNKKFDHYFFLNENGWFNSEDEFSELKTFIHKSKTKSMIASAPVFYLLNAIEITEETTHTEYIVNHTYSEFEHPEKKLGLRKSHESFYYDKDKKWAMFGDFTHNVVIIGVLNEHKVALGESFKDKLLSIDNFLTFLEKSQNSIIDHRTTIIEKYS